VKRIIFFYLAAAGLLHAQDGHPLDPAKGLILANEHVRLEFEPGGMGLAAMVDLKSGRNHIGKVDGKHLLWEVTFGRGTLTPSANNNYRPCSYARIEPIAGGGQRAVMEWNDLRWWLEDEALTVQVTVDLPGDSGVAAWRIFVENRSDYWGISRVAFPMVNGFPATGEYDVARPTFGSGGHLLRKWEEQVQGRHPSGGLPMQFMSLSAGRDSVYFGTFDGEGRAKDFTVEPGKLISLVHYPENMGVAGSDLPDLYPVQLGVYQGGWLEAAQRYREWALRQKWAGAGPLSRREQMPALMKDAALWINESWIWKDTPKAADGSSDMVDWVTEDTSGQGTGLSPQQLNSPLLDVQRRMGVPMALHWYNWHHMRFDNLYPHFLPAKPGFSERVKELVDSGILVMPYINGSSADMNIPDWDKFAPCAIVDEAGGFRQHLYSETAGRLLTMCPTQLFWQSTISTLVEKLIALYGVNAVYVDQISAMEHELCFSKSHGHPLGGGRYWTDGNRELLRKVRNVAQRAGRRVTITSEGADEVFLDLVDGNLTWAQATDWEIPLMQVVYSGYTILFGSPCDYRQSDRFFRFSQGQALIDGRQNGWMNLRMFQPEFERKVTYLRQCAQTRVANAKFLTYGQLLQPIEPLQAVPTFSEDVFGWYEKHQGVVPVAEGRLWRSEDGHLGVFLANYVDQEVTFSYRVDPNAFGLPGDAVMLNDVTPDGTRSLGQASGVLQRTERLGPAEIKVIEVSPSSVKQ
jgi:hypothetical protein